MKKLMCLLILILVIVGCGATETKEVKANTPSRMRLIEKTDINSYTSTYILKDTQTGVEYLWVDGGGKGGVVIMPKNTP